MPTYKRVKVIDSHTGGEPTRTVIAGGPPLGTGSLKDRLERFRAVHDGWRSAIVNEPRGSDVLVGALLTEPADAHSSAGVIFFNNVGYLGMCGHGTIGVIETLAHLGRIGPGRHCLDTPVGAVTAELHGDGRVSVHNVPSYRHAHGVNVTLEDGRIVTGDVAWGGNWFFLTDGHGLDITPDSTAELVAFSTELRAALARQGVTGAAGAEIDHVELFGPSAAADSRNFVLCPGLAWDRSPCGTGTSAKLACLHADGQLEPGVTWRQESMLGSVFEARYSLGPEGEVLPVITGRAHITAEAELLFSEADPFRRGFR